MKTSSGYSKGEWSTKPFYRINCITCGWQLQSFNGQGTAAQHARRHKHCVVIDVELTRIYNHEEQ